MEESPNWPKRFLNLAYIISQWSKDPNKKVGAVVVDQYRRILSTGYNGFPTGIADDRRLQDKDLKLSIILHAEENMLLNTVKSVRGGTVYLTHSPCSKCASQLIQAGIKTVVVPNQTKRHMEKYGNAGVALFKEAKVNWLQYKDLTYGSNKENT